MQPHYKNLSGLRFEKLKVLGRPILSKRSVGSTMWTCMCECGRVTTVGRQALLRGATRSCGTPSCRPGYTGNSLRPEYQCWYSMIDRCKPGHRAAENYHDRGIYVCSEWTGEGGFERFLKDVGERPSNDHSLDRINNDGIYEPGNVRWATSKEQINNRRKVKCLDKFSEEELAEALKKRGWVCQKI